MKGGLVQLVLYSIFGLCILTSSVGGQSTCSQDDFVVEKNGNVLLTLGVNGGSIPHPVVVGGDVSLLGPNDTLVVNGGIRFLGSATRPNCQSQTSGLLFYTAGANGNADSLHVCSQSTGPSVDYSWRSLHLSPVGVNGISIQDSWGSYWDGFPRNLASYAAAADICAANGARLPSFTDISRSLNLFATPGALISTDPYIWTSSVASDGYKFITRVSDTGVTNTAESDSRYFRCVWPSAPNYHFAGSNCYGQPTAPCYDAGVYNIDSYLRPALTFAQASLECNLKGGSLPTYRDLQNILGAPESQYVSYGLSVWVNSAFYTGLAFLSHTATLTASPSWSLYTYGGVAAGGTAQFVCVGRKPDVPLHPVPNLSCNGGCFAVVPSTKTPLFADSANRQAKTYYEASELCWQLGGQLPTIGMASDLIHAGWYQVSIPLWISSPSRLVGTSVSGLYITSTSAYLSWDPISYLIENVTDSLAEFRCVFPLSFTPSSPFSTCDSPKTLSLNTTTFEVTCSTPANGNSNGQQEGTANTDSVGYAWDAQGRSEITYQEAVDLCNSLGARLPLMGEVYRYAQIMQPTMPGDSVFDVYWTAVYNPVTNQATTINKLGSTEVADVSEVRKVRCVWPVRPFGNIFGGHKCHGGCFTVGNLVLDSYDRPAASIVEASQECQFLGGRLPTYEELLFLIRKGAPNGYNPCTGLNSAPTATCARLDGIWAISTGTANAYWAVRWLNTDPTWEPIYNPAAWSATSTILDSGVATDRNHFRCIFSTNLD